MCVCVYLGVCVCVFVFVFVCARECVSADDVSCLCVNG